MRAVTGNESPDKRSETFQRIKDFVSTSPLPWSGSQGTAPMAAPAELALAIDQSAKTLTTVHASSKLVNMGTSGPLVGTFCGFVGIAIGITVGQVLALPIAVAALAIIVGGGAGISGGLLMYRGPKLLAYEKELEAVGRALDCLIENADKAKKANLPDEVYKVVTSEIIKTVKALPNYSRSPPQIAPPPEVKQLPTPHDAG
jgi:hypothetical protein